MYSCLSLKAVVINLRSLIIEKSEIKLSLLSHYKLQIDNYTAFEDNCNKGDEESEYVVMDRDGDTDLGCITEPHQVTDNKAEEN